MIPRKRASHAALSSRHRPAHDGRRGIMVGMLLLALVVMLGVIALALELGLLTHAKLQLRAGCEAAALAGAVELMDEDILRPDRGRDPRDDIRAAQGHARFYGLQNAAAWDAIALRPNLSNNAEGDLRVGWLESACDRTETFVLWEPGVKTCNTLCVTARRTRRRCNPVGLLLSQILGVGEADMAAEAWATVDQHVYGFRPVGKSSAPVVPFAVLKSGGDGWMEQAFRPASAPHNDKYRVDYRTGHVRHGSDGIPEIELRVVCRKRDDRDEDEHDEHGEHGHKHHGGHDQDSHDDDDDAHDGGKGDGNLVGLLLRGRRWNPEAAERQLLAGLTLHDLKDLGGELALDRHGCRLVRGTKKLEAELAEALLRIRGLNRVWPLYACEGEREGKYKLVGFGAGRVVDACVNDDGQLVVRVQVSLLETCTALVRKEGCELNPWIGKLFLTRGG